MSSRQLTSILVWQAHTTACASHQPENGRDHGTLNLDGLPRAAKNRWHMHTRKPPTIVGNPTIVVIV